MSAILFAAPALACAQVDGIVCTDGEGTFSAKSDTGITVTIGASKIDGLASRLCGAQLNYHGKTIDVVQDAWQADVDAMGVEIEPRKPVVGIQFKDRSIDPQMTYAIYSLSRTPQLVRTIKGGDIFRAADFHLDGHIEIRTGDVAAADGFDGIPLSSFDFVPAVYLSLQNGKLMDVSMEFQADYDLAIGQLKTELDPAALQAFKSTNGKLDSIFLRPADEMHSLMLTKIKVLEIVWSYIYSGREAEAWSALNDMWPEADVERARAAILSARMRGIRKQVDGVSTAGPHLKIKHVHVYDTTVVFQRNQPSNSEFPQIGPAGGPVAQDSGMPRRPSVTDTDPIAIYLRSGCLPDNCSFSFQQNADITVELLLDDAGKVHVAKLVDDKLKGTVFDALLKSALSWKFVPAYKDGSPVACKIRQIISPNR